MTELAEGQKKIIEHYGFGAQILKLKEEAQELVDAISKKDFNNTIEEVADVLNVIQGLVLHSEIMRDRVPVIQKFKVNRQLERIAEGK